MPGMKKQVLSNCNRHINKSGKPAGETGWYQVVWRSIRE